MIETITPAVCGGRKRYGAALAAFTGGALVAAALLGGLLGVVGAAVGAREAVLVVAAVAALAAAREAGLVPLPLPQLRLQVPQRWHAVLPLPVWATGYGAGLGVGLLTYQPVATFWIACGAALSLGRPLAAAACFSLYGLGRAVMVVLPHREPDATAAVEALARRRPALRRVNAVALVACAALLAASPAAGAERLSLGAGSQLDPSISYGVLAYTQRGSSTSAVVVRVSDTETYTFAGARSPSIDGGLLAYGDDAGVRVVEWRTGTERARVAGSASHPALDWPWLAYRVDDPSGSSELVLQNVATSEVRPLVRASDRIDLGRPDVQSGRVAWQAVYPRGSRIVLYLIDSGTRAVVTRTRIGLLSHPALSSSRILWTDRRSGGTRLRVRRLSGGRPYTRVAIAGRSASMWTTAVGGAAAYFTRWDVATGAAKIYAVSP